MRKNCSIALFLLTLSLPVTAQTARLFTPENGLVSSAVDQVCQDRGDILWICSEGGLIRFDGMGFEAFRHDRGNPYSIPNDSVHDLCEDRTGTTWVGTASGLCILDSDYDTFQPFDLQDSRLPSSNQYISSVLEVSGRTSGSRIFVGTGGYGVYVIESGSRRLLHDDRERIYRHLPSDYVHSLFLDARRHLWITLEGDSGFIVLDVDTLEPASDFLWGPDLKSAQIRVTAITEDPTTGNVLVGTAAHGVLLYEASSGTIRKVAGTEVLNPVSAALYNPLQDDTAERSFLVGTENGGLYALDAVSGSLRPAVLPGVRREMEEKRCTGLSRDNQGNLWVCLYQTGLLLVPRSQFGFNYLGFSGKGLSGDNSACIMSFCGENGSDRLWVATDGAGLFCRERNGSVRNYNQHNSGLTNDAVMALRQDRRGTLWIGTYQDGLFRMGADGVIRKSRVSGQDGAERIRTLAYDPVRDRLYVGTHGAGVLLVNPALDQESGLLLDEDSKWISSLFVDAQGRLWIGTYNGPRCYDPESGLFSGRSLLPDGSLVRVYAVTGGQDGTMWFGSSDGLFSLSPDGRDIHQYHQKDGLPDNVVRDILCTPAGDLWISTTNGLSHFSPGTGQFTNYYASDGLQGNEFRSGAAYQSPSGRLYFGGPGGVTSFNPILMDHKGHPVPQVRLSGFTLLNDPVHYDPELGEKNLIDKQISEATHIDVPVGTGLFSLSFSVPEYSNPQRVVYSYRLHGFDPDWNTAPAGLRVAAYTNVPPGRYRFEVRASFAGTPEEFTERGIDIRVRAPWYRRSWAYLLYLCLAGILGTGLFLLYRSRQRRKQEIEDAELKELRLGLFTNLTHEIRTPLSLVMDPLRTMREEEPDPDRKDTYNLMYRNCLRINRLVNQLMDIRKIDAGQMPMHFRETDLVYFIKDIMQSFLDLARSKHVSFSIHSDRPEELLWVDQGNFDKIVYNILSNAFKHTPDGGRIRIGVSAPVPNDRLLSPDIRQYVEVSVFNSGSRIEDAYISKIFDRFVQIDPYDASTGSGVGLNLTKMLVGLHHGQISAENQEDGVVFRVLVPVGKEHLTEEELSVTTHHKDLYVKGREIKIDNHEDETFVPESGPDEGKAPSGRKRVVIVEDDDEMRKYLKAVLRPVYQVTACADGREAWPVITSTVPDAVVTDLVMPGMNGTELCRRIRQNPSTNHIPVLVLTGQDGDEEEQAATDSGADRFLSKPVSGQLLLSGLAQAISARDTVMAKFSPAMDFDYSGIEMGSADEKLLRRIVEAIRRNLENPEFDVAVLCEEVGISRVHLNRKLKETGNVPPSVLIKSFRMKQAAYLLVNNKVNVSEVAYRVGYSSHSYFTSSFRDYFGMTPREFVAKYIDHPEDENLKKLLGLNEL